MQPTSYLRFVERTEIIDSNPETGISTGRTIRVLQQFWETPYGTDVVGDMFIQIYGKWLEVPFVKEKK